ncbi:MAG: FoF1 ATP synthase subunit a [Actinomycetota bacterium]
MSEGAIAEFTPYIVIANAVMVSLLLIVGATIAARQKLTPVPGPVQNAAEAVMEWFIKQAKNVRPDAVKTVTAFLATFFLFIFSSNLLGLIPVPVIRIPPTSFYSVTLALSLCSVFGILILTTVFKGVKGTLKHLVWPNPLQIISEISHALSLSLRLFGNIGGEFIVASLVMVAAPYGIPLIVHILGLIPAFLQALVFTLLTASALGIAIAIEEEPVKEKAEPTTGTIDEQGGVQA